MSNSEKYGLIGSVISTALLILLLFLIVMPGLKTPEDEGIMISFGNANDGAGVTQTPAATPQPEPPAPKPTTPATPKVTPPKENLMTQKDPSVVALEEQKKKEKQEREAIERKKREEEQRIAEQKRKEQEAIDRANNSMSGLFGSGGTTGSGNTSGNNTQGNPAGSGTSGGNSWSLSGRSLSGQLVRPIYKSGEPGQITINIKVDINGTVISTSLGKPTNISDRNLIDAAKEAARRTIFSKGNSVAVGSITYNFVLN